jgi:hypothetical protein
MKNLLLLSAGLVALAATLLTQPVSVMAEEGNVAPTVSIGTGRAVFGVEGTMPIAKDFSARANAKFPQGNTILGLAVTYDKTYGNFTPYVGLGVDSYMNSRGRNISSFVGLGVVGLDYKLNKNLMLKTGVSIPLTETAVTTATFGIGYIY